MGDFADDMYRRAEEEQSDPDRNPTLDLVVDDVVLGYCPHGVNLDRAFCPEGCRV